MASDMCVRRLTKELKALKKEPIVNPKISVAPDEKNLLEIHYAIEGTSGTPYEGGVYHGKLVFPKDYPLKPPSITVLTPNGRFFTGRSLCLSMSNYHQESWSCMWNISSILTGMYSFWTESTPTLGSIETSERKKRQLAAASLDWNVKNSPIFCKLFPEYVERNQAEAKERLATGVGAMTIGDGNGILGLRQGGLDNIPFAATLAGLIAFISIVMAYLFL